MKREYDITACSRKEDLFHYFYTKFTVERPKRFYYGPTCELSKDAVFNLKFNQDGILVAVYASGEISLLDPRIRGVVDRRRNAHDDCANIVCFMDKVRFFTGSDDCTIKLWDLRNMSNSLNTFVGHTNWVKNLEYDSQVDLLYSSAFDETVRVWDVRDMNKPSSILASNSLLFRMCVSPKRDCLVLTTRSEQLFTLLPTNWYEERLQRYKDDPPLVHVDEHYKNVQLKLMKRTLDAWLKPAGVILNSECLTNYHPSFLPLNSSSVCFHRLNVNPSCKKLINLYSICFDNSGEYLALRGTARNTSDYDLKDVLLTFHLKGMEEDSMEDWRSGSKRIVAEYTTTRHEPGIIKEIAYDHTGRYLASPDGKDVILFDSRTQLSSIVGRCSGRDGGGIALTCQFSPIEPFVASGNMDGHVGFHYPYL